MKTTHHSEYLKLKTVYIKTAKNAFVSQSLLKEQWEDLNYLSQPNFKKAEEEYKPEFDLRFIHSLEGFLFNLMTYF